MINLEYLFSGEYNRILYWMKSLGSNRRQSQKQNQRKIRKMKRRIGNHK